MYVVAIPQPDYVKIDNVNIIQKRSKEFQADIETISISIMHTNTQAHTDIQSIFQYTKTSHTSVAQNKFVLNTLLFEVSIFEQQHMHLDQF